MRIGHPLFIRSDSGQALVETALVLPVLLAVILNAINFGYYSLVALNVTAAPRTGVLYSIQGFSSANAGYLPGASISSAATTSGSVGYVVFEDMHGSVPNYSASSVQICTKSAGTSGTGAALVAKCVTCSSQSSCGTAAVVTGAKAPSSDPEASTFNFVLNRVDVTYTFTPLINGAVFNVALLPSSVCSGGTCTFHRQVSMRAMD